MSEMGMSLVGLIDRIERSTFYLVHKNSGRLKAGDVVGRNRNGLVLRDDTSHFFLSVFHHKATKLSNVNILTTGERILHNCEETFQGCRYICLVDSSFLGDLYNYFCLGHRIVIF